MSTPTPAPDGAHALKGRPIQTDTDAAIARAHRRSWQGRVEMELDALQTNLDKLHQFTYSDAIEALSAHARELLEQQVRWMEGYAATLQARLDLDKCEQALRLPIDENHE